MIILRLVTGYELIQYVNKEFEKYENLTVHYEQSLDCGYETINTFQLMITTEYLDNGKVKLCRGFPAFNYNFKHLFEFHFDDVLFFSRFIWVILFHLIKHKQ